MKNQDKKDIKTFTRKQVFMTLLPWEIIFTLALVFVGFVSGWNYRGIQQDKVRAEASQMVDALSKSGSH